jgi:hypothetical protein
MNSSKKYFALQVGDLLEQINKLDVLIAMHKEAGHKIELQQYESLKLKFVKELLTLLINSELNSADPQTFPLVSRLMHHFYPGARNAKSQTAGYQALSSVLAPFFPAEFAPAAMAQEPEAVYNKD